MRKNSRTRFLPIVILPAILPAAVMPALNHRIPDGVLGLLMGICIGLALVGLVWMARGRNSPTDR